MMMMIMPNLVNEKLRNEFSIKII